MFVSQGYNLYSSELAKIPNRLLKIYDSRIAKGRFRYDLCSLTYVINKIVILEYVNDIHQREYIILDKETIRDNIYKKYITGLYICSPTEIPSTIVVNNL